jgi:hypothetical protein
MAGSFCLFCENGEDGLPTVTKVSGLNAKAGIAVVNTNNRTRISPALRTARETYIFAPFNIFLKYRKRIEAIVNKLSYNMFYVGLISFLLTDKAEDRNLFFGFST